MAEGGAYGRQLAAAFRLPDAPVLMARTEQDATLAMTELQVRPEASFRSGPLKIEDAYLIFFYLTDHQKLQVWEEGDVAVTGRVQAGEMVILDLRRAPAVFVDKPFHLVGFYLPRDVLDDVADRSEAPRVGGLSRCSSGGVPDETIAGLLQTVMGGFRHPESIGRLFVDHVSLALVTHVAQTYGGMRPQTRAQRGGLAPWQEKRVKELVQSRLADDLSVGELASECGLSLRHFCRAFRHSIGNSPHSYIQTSRVDKAKKLLAASDMKLTDVGSACGFADQSHFTRVFTQFAGMTPGIWRRNTTAASFAD